MASVAAPVASGETFAMRLARIRREYAARQQWRQRPVQYATFEMSTFVEYDAGNELAAQRLARALTVKPPRAIINENRLSLLLAQVKLKKIRVAVPEPTPAEPAPEPAVPEPVPAPEPPQPVALESVLATPELARRRRRRKRTRRRVAFEVKEHIEPPPEDVAVEPIDTMTPQRPTQAQVRAARRQRQRQASQAEAIVASVDANVLPTAEPLFTDNDTEQDDFTLEQAAENPMLWKEWLADKGLEVSEVLAAWSATGAVTSGMVGLAGAAASPFVGSLFVPMIASALLAPVARKATGVGVNAMSGFLRRQLGIRRAAQVNPPSHAPPSAEQRAQVRSAARRLGSFMWNNMTSIAGAAGLAGSAGQVASAALGIVNHATSPEVVAEAIRLGVVLATDGVWGVPWWAMRAAYNVGTSRVGITIAARWVQQHMGWDRVGGEVGAYVQRWMQENEVGEGRVFGSLMSENLQNQIRERFGEEAYQNFVETSWADITSFVVREYADMTIRQGTEQMTVEGARAVAHVYQDVRDSGALEAAVQTVAEARNLAQTATAKALEAGASVAEAMRAGTVKMWEAVTGSEAVAESTQFVLQESTISAAEEQELETVRREQSIEAFREAQAVRNVAKAARATEHQKRHIDAMARSHQRRIEQADANRAVLEQALPDKLNDEIVQDAVRHQELDAQLRQGTLNEAEHAVAVEQLMTDDKRDQILDNLTEKGLRFGGALTEGFRGLKIKPLAGTVGSIVGGAIGGARQTWVNRIVGTDRTEILIKDARTWERVAATGRLQSVFTRVAETVITQGDPSRASEIGQAVGRAAGQIGMASAGTASQQTATVLTFSKQAFDALTPAAKAEVTALLQDALATGTVAATQVVGETLATTAAAAINNIDNVTTTYTTARNTIRYSANVMGAMGHHDQNSWMGWLGDGMSHLVETYTPDIVGLQNQYLGLGEVDLGQVVGEFMRDRYILRRNVTTAELAAEAANKILFGTGVPDAEKSAAREALEVLLVTTFTTADSAGQYIYGTRDTTTGAPLLE